MDYLWVLEPETEYNVSGNEHDAVKNKHDKGINIFCQLIGKIIKLDRRWCLNSLNSKSSISI